MGKYTREGVVLRRKTWWLDCIIDGERYQRKLGKGISRSAAVRLDCIKTIEPSTHGDYGITLTDGKRLALSRRFVNASLRRFMPKK